MLARLQQLFCLLWLTALGTVIVMTLQTQAWGLGLLAVLALCLGHALVLAVEFGWMHRHNRHDPAPRAGWAQVCRAWWAECRHAPAVFCWQQPFRSRQHADDTHRRGHRGVLLVHGYVCNRGLWNDWMRTLRAQGHPVIALNMEPVFGSISDYGSQIDAAIESLQSGTGLPPVVVAHSMGGLAVRAWWCQPGKSASIHELITLGTPHQGTWLARWGASRNAREMQMRSPWLQALQASEPSDHAARTTCYFSHCDNIVFPASNATLPGADNRHLPGVAHVAMVRHPVPWQDLLQRLKT